MVAQKVSYRLAKFSGEREESPSLENELRTALGLPHIKGSYPDRVFQVHDAGTKGLIHNFDLDPPGVFAEVLQVDARRTLPFIEHGATPTPLATVKTRTLPANEEHMGPAAYLLVIGDHMALIEGLGMRGSQVQIYINALLQKAGQLTEPETWTLIPKVEVEEGSMPEGSVSRLDIVPTARILGDGPSETAQRTKRKPSAALEEKLAHGSKVFDILRVLGASDADLGLVRGQMSTDLGLEARVVITVRKGNRSTEATLDTAAVAQTVASLEAENSVTVVSPDHKQRGRLVTLARSAEIRLEGGLLDRAEVAVALTAALKEWTGKGIINIDWA